MQHQDVELWEMYEEDERSIAAQRQYRNDRRSSRNGMKRRNGQEGRQIRKVVKSNRDREPVGSGGRNGRDRVVTGSSGRNSQGRQVARNDRRERREREAVRGSERGVQERYGEREYGRANNTYSRNAGRMRTREAEGSGRSRMELYEMGQSNSRQRNRSARTENRQSVNVIGSRRADRSGGVSQVSYIQPYSETERRRRNPEYAYRGTARPVQSIKRRRARRRREFLCKMAIVLFVVICLGIIYYITGQIYQIVHQRTEEKPLPVMTEQAFDNEDNNESVIGPPNVIQDFLEINEYSRPGTRLDRINSIFVHYTANPGTSAAQNRSYFANLAETHERSASAHLIIGYDGELIQCIPFDEQAYAVMTRNEDSISIECCYLSEDGSFTRETYDTLIHTLAWLLKEYNLTTDDILRHYDCGGKKCPLYYTENEGEWEQLRQDVAAYMAITQQEEY